MTLVTFQIETHANPPFPTGRYRAAHNSTDIWSVADGYDAADAVASITDLVAATRIITDRGTG